MAKSRRPKASINTGAIRGRSGERHIATDNATIEEITLYTFPLFASLFSFKVRKQTVLKHVKWQDYGNKEIDKLISLMIKQTRSIIALYKKETKDKADG